MLGQEIPLQFRTSVESISVKHFSLSKQLILLEVITTNNNINFDLKYISRLSI